MILDSFLRGLHSDRKLNFSGILFTSDRLETNVATRCLYIIQNTVRLVFLLTSVFIPHSSPFSLLFSSFFSLSSPLVPTVSS